MCKWCMAVVQLCEVWVQVCNQASESANTIMNVCVKLCVDGMCTREGRVEEVGGGRVKS